MKSDRGGGGDDAHEDGEDEDERILPQADGFEEARHQHAETNGRRGKDRGHVGGKLTRMRLHGKRSDVFAIKGRASCQDWLHM